VYLGERGKKRQAKVNNCDASTNKFKQHSKHSNKIWQLTKQRKYHRHGLEQYRLRTNLLATAPLPIATYKTFFLDLSVAF
jgi:hypothetical protein